MSASSSAQSIAVCSCGHTHFDHRGAYGGSCVLCTCPAFHEHGTEMEPLREALAWTRTFNREAQRHLIGQTNDYRRAAKQLRAILDRVLAE
jgi:hypothetical protein